MWLTAGPMLSKFLAWRDLAGLAVVAAAGLAMWAYRATYIEPLAWGVLCAAAVAPFACVPRAGLLWLQRDYLFGGVALALGLLAFLARGPFALAVAAMVIGIAGVENYNATWGMLGAALGAWRFIRPGESPPALCKPAGKPTCTETKRG